MENRSFSLALVAIAASVLSAGCAKESVLHPNPGSQIAFGASLEWVNGDVTRTVYSGKNETGGNVGSGSSYERIDWEPGYDRVRILCAAAENGPYADYNITGDLTVVAQKSQAKVSPTSSPALLWGDESKDHYFYALFPAEGMTSKLGKTVSVGDATIAVAMDGESQPTRATVTGKIPASQSAVKDGDVYRPDMNHAYMYAVTKVNAGGAGTVSLSFQPLVTTFEFTLLTPPGDPVTSKLTTVKLTSSSTSLSGNFTASLTPSGLTPLTSSDITSAGREISVTLPDGGVLLDDETPIKVTLFALPVKQSQLTLELVFASGATRKLELKKNSNTEWVEVSACKKIYIQNVGVPGSIYYLDVTGPTSSISSDEQSVGYQVKSFRDASGSDVGVGWTAKFLEDGSTEWATDPPSWLTGFTKRDESGSVTGKSYSTTVAVNDYSVPSHWKGPTTASGNVSKATALDLSLQDIYGNAIGRTTANCYVITKPGWYKFPCVYGNALKNNAWNEIAYKNTNSTPNALQKFVRHDGNPITDPWITANTTINKAQLLWMDAPDLVTNMSYEDNFIYFEVPTGQQGNAVIAAEQTDNTIVWSWHIWMTEGIDVSDNLKTQAVYSHPTNNHSIVEPNYVMNTNLGWYDAANIGRPRSVRVQVTQDDSGKTGEFIIFQRQEHAFGGNVHFQWGRKDPVLGFDEYYEEKTQYYPSGSTQYFQVENTASADRSLAYAIRNPNKFIIIGEWSDASYTNLWNVNGEMLKDLPVVKTVYDPCPVGFKVPNMYAFSGFSTTGYSRVGMTYDTSIYGNTIGHWQMGWYFKCSDDDTKGIFFPATTLRETSSGEVRNIYFGWCWTASRTIREAEPDVKYLGAFLEYGYSGFIDVARDHGAPTYGFSIRPVKE